jgi:glyoxylase-like metal-dependent hydrolase (beta-lactamase superfamily II)
MIRAGLSIACLVAATLAVSAQGGGPPAPAAVHVLPVQRNVSMLVGPNGNSAVQVGADGVLLVDAQDAAISAQLLAAVRTLSPKPLQNIVYTSFHAQHTAGSEALLKAGGGSSVRVMAHENVTRRMQNAAAGGAAFRLNAAITVPVNSPYFTPTRDFFYNGEPIVLYHAPAAHTDGDTIVFFRGSDVVATGDIFNPDLYPFIDVQNGGSVNGVIDALNRVLELTVPAKFQEGGTYVIPGRGRLCDEADVVEYRDMVTIIRDRVQELVKKKMTLQQVKAARPSRDYDADYGAASGPWTTDMFIEAVYRSLGGK